MIGPDATYRLYGLNVRTSLPLDPAPHTARRPDITIEDGGSLDPVACPKPHFFREWRTDEDAARLTYEIPHGKRLEFTFTAGGRQLVIRATPELTETLTSIFIGPVIAAAHHLRGALLLHGAGVTVDHRAIVMLGNSGSGKSTLATAMTKAGAHFLTEELVTTGGGAGQPIQPGFPRIGLDPGALGALGLRADLPRVLPQFDGHDKRWVDVSPLSGGFHEEAVPFGIIYILRRRFPAGSQLSITPLDPPRATLALLGHFYGGGWLAIPRDRALAFSAGLCASVPVCDIVMPEGLDRVMDVARAILADAQARLTAAQQTGTLRVSS